MIKMFGRFYIWGDCGNAPDICAFVVFFCLVLVYVNLSFDWSRLFWLTLVSWVDYRFLINISELDWSHGMVVSWILLGSCFSSEFVIQKLCFSIQRNFLLLLSQIKPIIKKGVSYELLIFKTTVNSLLVSENSLK